MELDLSKLSCQRPECSDYGVRGKGNLRPHGHSGQWTQIHCRTCRRTFSERRFLPLYPIRLPGEQLVRILLGLTADESIRGVARKEGLDKMTVQNVVRQAEEKRRPLQQWLVQDQRLKRTVARRIARYLQKRQEVKRKNRYD